jgi:hypothetical protein
MVDSNDTQSPPAPVQAPQAATPLQVTVAPSATVTDKVESAVETGAKSVLKDLWGKYGVLFLLVGLFLLVAKFSDVIMDILGWSSKKDLQKAQATDTTLKAEADAANQQANDLVKKANELPNQEGTVDADWDKKQ